MTPPLPGWYDAVVGCGALVYLCTDIVLANGETCPDRYSHADDDGRCGTVEECLTAMLSDELRAPVASFKFAQVSS